MQSPVLDAERRTLLALRDHGTIGDRVWRGLQEELDREAVLEAPHTPSPPKG